MSKEQSKERLEVQVSSVEDIIKLIKDKVEPQIREWEELYYQDLKKRYNQFSDEWKRRSEEGDKTPYWDIYPEFMNKTEYNIIYGRNEKGIREILRKDGDLKLKRIDVAVKKKIKDEIKEVTCGSIYGSLEMGEIDGEFDLLTVNGEKKVLSFESILAGGHNIQRLHFRTLFKYKDRK